MMATAIVDYSRLLFILSIFLVCQSCTNSIETEAADIGMVASTVQSHPFKHRLFRLAAQGENPQSIKVILVDGDGRAFINPTTVASDPTPLHSSLLALAPDLAGLGDVLYLGRPCYHQLQDPECNPLLWTLARYSQGTIDSSVGAVKQLIEPDDRIILVGYSGGGVIAMLMARDLFPEVFGVVTYGSPLDTDAWTAFHGYTDLVLSENPARDPDSFNDFCQIHLFGNRDQIVPKELVASWTWRSKYRTSVVSSDHSCCWQPAVLNAVLNLDQSCAAD